MIAYSYYNIEKKDRDKYIYRIVSFDRFKEILKHKNLGFVNPALWDDPYENFLLNQTITTKDGLTKSFKSFSDVLYGSCWTLNSNSDYAWKVYAPKKNGVQIKIRISDLYKTFEFLKDDENLATFQIGKVEYWRWKLLKERYESSEKLDVLGFLMNTTSFIKRFEYRHEKEVRILLRYQNHNDKVLPLHFNLNDFSKSILMDPRIDDDSLNTMKKKIKILGYKGKIYRSTLYKAPSLKIKFDNLFGKL